MASSRDCPPKSLIIKAHQSQVGLNAPHTSPPRPHTCHQKSLSYSLCVPSTHHQFFYPVSTNIFAEWINLYMKPAVFSPRTCSINLFFFFFPGTSLVAQTVKHLSTMRETWVQSLDWEDPLEKEMAIHSSTLAWKIPWTEEPGRLQSMGSQRVRHNWATSLHFTSNKPFDNC